MRTSFGFSAGSDGVLGHVAVERRREAGALKRKHAQPGQVGGADDVLRRLVEVGVGLLPAGAGCKELALRAAEESRRGAVGSQLDMFPPLRAYFQTVATATVAKSALEAKELGFLRPSDIVVMNAYELLHVAKTQARALAAIKGELVKVDAQVDQLVKDMNRSIAEADKFIQSMEKESD